MKHRLRSIFFVFSISCALSSAVAAAEPMHNAISLQGYTGILNTPNAHVTDEGWLYATYNNQEESKWRNRVSFQDNYQISIGMFNFIEIGGRFFESPGAGRDLSANFKITSAPFTRDYPLLPVIALGVQDVGGGDTKSRSRYGVISQDIWRLRLSAGYGVGPDRMEGAFAGGEFKVHDWLYLLGEYDSTETNVGARLILPQFWKVPVRFTASVKSSIDHNPGNLDIAVGLTVPLDFRMKGGQGAKPSAGTPNVAETRSDSEPGPSADAKPRPHRVETYPSGASGRGPVYLVRTTLERSLPAVRDSLVREGFLNVRVGSKERTLVVEYENSIFNHNELDALGLVAGLACETAPEGFDTVTLVIKRRNIRMAAVSAPLEDFRAFLEQPQGEGVQGLRDRLEVDFDTRVAEQAVFTGGDANSGTLNTSLMLFPGLTTFIGTEAAAFDYLLALKPELITTLWKGAALTARWNLPVSWSENLDDGMVYRDYRQGSQLDRLMLFQALKPLPSVMVNLGGGMIVADRYGMLNEALWSPGDGGHRFRVAQGWDKHDKTRRQSDLLIGSYRYFYSPLDLYLEAAAGKFWAEDKGMSLELKRFWGDTSISFYYKDSKAPDDRRWRAVGLQFAVPLTPRRDMKHLAKIQLRGADEWSYAQETSLKNNHVNSPRGELNYLAPYPLIVNPQPAQALYRSFYNRDRLSAAYIRQHLDRLQEAWQKYGANRY